MNLPVYKTVIKVALQANFIIICLLIFCVTAKGQKKTLSDTPVSIDVKNIPFKKVLSIIEQQTSYKFAYNTELIAKQKNISLNVQNTSLSELMQLLLNGSGLSYSIIDNQIVLQEIPLSPKITISGYINDSISGESLPGAIIYLPETKTGTSSNNYSFYSITVNQADSLVLMVSHIGYKKVYKKVSARHSFTLSFNLAVSEIQIRQILVTKDNLDDNLKKYLSGKTEVSLDMIKTVPAVTGSGDIINSIQMLPGIMAGLDGRSGYFVRGGNADQNLVQLDEATLYNPTHLFGLVSILNTSVIKSSTLLKAGFPASYGDNLSSVLDISMKDGNKHQFGGDLHIGTIAAGLTLHGPIIHNKSSFLLSARRSTIDQLLKPLQIANYYSNYYFYDVNAKLNFQLSQNDRIYLSLYHGRDNSSYSGDSTDNNEISYGIQFGNQALTLRWNHLYSQKLFSNTSMIYNSYYQSLSASQQQYYADLYSGIRDMNFKTDLNYYPNPNHKISGGVNYLYQALFPASVSDKAVATGSIITINPYEIPKKYASRWAVYFSDDIKITSKVNVYLGARMSLFYMDDAQYLNVEPRLSLLYLLNPTTSLKLGYAKMHQHLHLVQSYNASFPAEIWTGSNKIIKPQNSQQISAGIFKNFKDNMFQTSLEIYYKKMGNQLLFKGELQPVINTNIDSSLIFGKGQAYGTELFIRKNTGKLTGWLAYKLSYAFQHFDSLNLGKQFPFANDRRHCLYVMVNYAINQHWEVSANFLFTSGRAFTLKRIDSNINQDENPLYDEGNNNGTSGDGTSGDGSSDGAGDGSSFNGPNSQIQQNNYRLAPYNRFDISISYRKKRNLPRRVIETEWVFSVYNVYARPNTFFAYRSIDPVTKQPVARQVSFVPIIPSISFSLKF